MLFLSSRTRPRRALFVAALLLPLLLALPACTDTLVEPESTTTEANVFDDPSSYRAFLAKLYGGLVVTGQEGPSGDGDIQGIDEGFSQYTRLLWELQELPTDEAVIAWGDNGIQPLNVQNWTSSNQFVAAMYDRIYFQISLANEFLRETTEAKLSERDVSEELRTDIQQFRAEARFLRALSYWHGLDLYGNIPLVTTESGIGTEAPEQSSRQEVFDFAVSELKAIQDALPAPGEGEYGRADRGAAQMLLAKLQLNAEVYAGQTMYDEALSTTQRLLDSGAYTLEEPYSHLFLADNHTADGIVFSVPQDGENTRTFGNTTFMSHAPVGNQMDPAAYGLDFGWWGVRTTPDVVNIFPDSAEASDARADFFTEGQSKEIENLMDYTQGYTVAKYRNVTAEGEPGSNLAIPDTDFPMFRLADAYLMYAEAVLRGGGGSESQAVEYVNRLRERAYGDASGNIDQSGLTLDFLLEERARELLWEVHRRTDLIRFGRFTESGRWAWKGGVQQGQATEGFRTLYPLPASELRANPNLEQNPGY